MKKHSKMFFIEYLIAVRERAYHFIEIRVFKHIIADLTSLHIIKAKKTCILLVIFYSIRMFLAFPLLILTYNLKCINFVFCEHIHQIIVDLHEMQTGKGSVTPIIAVE